MLLRNSPSPMLLYAPDLSILYVNDAHLRMTGRTREDMIGRHMFDVFAPNPESDDAASAQRSIEAAVAEMIATGQPHIIEEQQHDLPSVNGNYEPRFWSMVQWPIHEDGSAVAILQRSEDITEHVRQRRLLQAEKRSAEAISGLAFFSYDPGTDEFIRSAGVDTMFGFASGEAGQQAGPFFARIVADDLPAVHTEVERAMAGGPGTSAAFDYRVAIPGYDQLRYIRVRAGIERDPDDGIPKLFGAFVDMTDVEQARARMEDLSQRNAALVAESNHRIKNSLAIAAAMLSYQMRATEDADVQKALQAAATRIMAISDVHGELFAETGIEWVDAGNMLERFAGSFARTIDAVEAGCRINVTAQSIRLPSRYAVTLALMLNELLTNAVKYGMSQHEICEIMVELQVEENDVKLSVVNSIASEKFTQIVSEGVGTELVQAFAQQLDGSVEAGARDGNFVVVFGFPIPADDLALRETDL